MSNEQPVKDVDFDAPTNQKKKINYKEVFLQLNEGDNLIRFINMKGKKIGTHWVKDLNGKQRSVKCPIEGCPCCREGVQTQYKTFMKVVDKLGSIKIFEFGPQIMNQIKRIISDLKEDDPNASLPQRDIIVNKGAKGSNPLYNVKLVKFNPKPSPSEQLRQQAIEEAIKSDELDLSEIVVPWSVSRINEYIYGIKEDGQPLVPKDGGEDTQEDTSFNYGANVENTDTSKKSEEDLSMFD